MHSVDSELQKLQKAEREACNRLTRFSTELQTQAIEAAKSICAEVLAALRAYSAKRKSINE